MEVFYNEKIFFVILSMLSVFMVSCSNTKILGEIKFQLNYIKKIDGCDLWTYRELHNIYFKVKYMN